MGGSAGEQNLELRLRLGRPLLLGDTDDASPAQPDALAHELIEHDRGAFGIILPQGLERIEHGHVRAQPAEGLGKFEADRAGPDHDEMLGTSGEVEGGLAGQARHALEPRNRRQRGRGPGGNNKAPGRDLDVARDREGAGIPEPRGARDHPHPEPGEPFRREVGGARRHDGLHMRAHAAEIGPDRLGLHPEVRRPRRHVGAPGGGSKRAQRQVAGPDGGATGLASRGRVDQHHPHPETRGQHRRLRAAGRGPDDANVGSDRFRHARLPIGATGRRA